MTDFNQISKAKILDDSCVNNLAKFAGYNLMFTGSRFQVENNLKPGILNLKPGIKIMKYGRFKYTHK